jgi:hypothetical protein
LANDLESNTSSDPQAPRIRAGAWFKIAILTAGSAFIGGVAAAWWYRKTLTKLHENGETSNNPHFGMPIDQVSDPHDEM